MKRNQSLALMLLCIACTVGCGPPDYYELSGTVTKDGKPIPHLEITLAPDAIDSTRPPLCLSKEDGSFILRTGRESGVPPGSYTFHIADPAAADGGTTPKKDDPFYEDYMYVVERYSSANSDLKYEADAHRNDFNLDLVEKEYTTPKVKLQKGANTTDNTGRY